MTAEKREFRVTWQRQGVTTPRTRIFQREHSARRLVAKLSGQILDPDRDPDDRWCCPGGAWEEGPCPCRGVTVAERVRQDHEAVPPMVLGPVIESRPVGEWEHVETAPPDPREPWPVVDGRVVSPHEAARALIEPTHWHPNVHPALDDIPF